MYDVNAGTVLAWLHQGRLGGEGEGWYKLGRRYFIRPVALTRIGKESRLSKPRSFRLPRQRNISSKTQTITM